MNNRIKLAMFDLDGTLFDTALANYFSYRDACREFVTVTENIFVAECFGKNYREFLPQLGVSNEKDIEYVHNKKKEIYPHYFDQIRANDLLFEIARQIKENGTFLALVTTASRKNVLDLLSYFQYQNFFDLLVTQESVEKLKPAPDAFLYAMDYFGVENKECMIFEDSEVGIWAAEQCKATVFKVAMF